MKRTTREYILQTLEKKSNWNVVDLGCGSNAGCEYANVLVDASNWSSNYLGRSNCENFVVHDVDNLPLPFDDKEFDFCFCSHLLEHVKDPITFLKEVTRISKRGYIEVPTPLADNLVSGNDWNDPRGHKWWIYYDDINEKIILRPRKLIVHRTLEIPELNKLYPFFRSSMVIELYWDETIDAVIGDEKYFYEDSEYDLSKQKITPWVLGESVLRKLPR